MTTLGDDYLLRLDERSYVESEQNNFELLDTNKLYFLRARIATAAGGETSSAHPG